MIKITPTAENTFYSPASLSNNYKYAHKLKLPPVKLKWKDRSQEVLNVDTLSNVGKKSTSQTDNTHIEIIHKKGILKASDNIRNTTALMGIKFGERKRVSFIDDMLKQPLATYEYTVHSYVRKRVCSCIAF